MKLMRLAVDRLPGISQPFEIEGAGAGVHVVYGPNGVGKSSLCRALEGLYWEECHPSPLTATRAEFEWNGESWWTQRNGNRVTWQREGENRVPPSLPPSYNDRCFFLRLRDLIDPSRDGTADIASEIQRQMSGGFDLDGIAADLFASVSRHLSRRRHRDFNNASDSVQKSVMAQADLRRRADELAALRSRLDAAETAARRLVFVERAIGLARRRQELAGIVARIEALPDALAKITGKEVEEVERYQHQADTLAERARSLEQELAKAREIRREAALAGPLGRSDLEVWRDSADELSRIELELDAAKTERGATRRALAAAVSAVGGDVDVEEVALSLAEHGELFAFLRSSQEHAVQVTTVRERLRQLDRFEPSADGGRDLERLRAGAEALRAWLRAPETEGIGARLRSRWPWLLFAGVMILAGSVGPLSLTTLLGPLGLDGVLEGGMASTLFDFVQWLAVLGIGAALAVLLPGNRGSIAARRAAQANFDELGLDEPAEWDIPSVESYLTRLERVAADRESAMEQARDRSLERQRLTDELESLSEQETELDTRRQALGAKLGLEALQPDAELVDLARSLDQLRQARLDDEAAAGKVEGLEHKRDELLAELAGILESHGEPEPDNAAAARARLHSLADRNSRLEQAIAEERTRAAQVEENAADREAALQSIRRIYAEAGLEAGDLNGLATLIHSLDHYRGLISDKTGLEGQIRLDGAELDKAGEAELAAWDEESLERLKEDLVGLETTADELRNEIAEINAQTDAARGGQSVQGLIAVREEARAGLRDLRDETLYAKAGQFLLDAVGKEYEQTRMPRVLERARDHFLGFTHHNYSLDVGKEDGTPRLFARESRTGEARELDELSDGTRVQLLLAARIAFAEEVEQGKVLPIFLDEALDQSDPRRFEAMVRSLGRVARQHNRQIFYLTSDPRDVDRIRDALGKEGCELAAEIDLGLIRTKAASVAGPQDLRFDPGPAVPAPDGRSAEEYAAALDVPAFRPDLGYGEQHLFYVLWDAPDSLHDLLLNGIERAGQWRIVSGTALAERLCSRPLSPADMSARLDLLETFCDLWMQGKGRPVDRDALERSEALTDGYLDDVVAIAQQLNGDAERLVVLLKQNDPRLRGFRKSNAEKLQRYLLEGGYLDDRPVLTEDELRLRAQTTPAAARLTEGLANDCLRRWWEWARNSSRSF